MNGIQLNRRRFIVLANLLVNAIFYLNPLFSKNERNKNYIPEQNEIGRQ